MTIAKKFIVSGQVQGVWYRVCTRERAQQLNLTGWACNRDDGTVEVLACGDAERIEELERWLWTGSPQSTVSNVESRPGSDQPPDDFTIG